VALFVEQFDSHAFAFLLRTGQDAGGCGGVWLSLLRTRLYSGGPRLWPCG
jgi:hypothetical protein